MLLGSDEDTKEQEVKMNPFFFGPRARPFLPSFSRCAVSRAPDGNDDHICLVPVEMHVHIATGICYDAHDVFQGLSIEILKDESIPS